MNVKPLDPDYIIIGAQKAGTTTLAGMLSQASNVVFPHAEIPWLESPYYESGGAQRIRYLCGRISGTVKRVGIKRPNYLPSQVVAERISLEFPNTRLIAVLRNPVTRAFSATLHYMEYGHIPVMDPNLALQRILDGDDLNAKRSYEILDWGLYSQQLVKYRQLPNVQITVMDQRQLFSNPATAISNIPGLETGDLTKVSMPIRNAGADGMRNLKMRNLMHRSLTAKDSRTGDLLPRTSNPFRLASAAAFKQAALKLPQGQPLELEEDTRERLISFYMADDEKLLDTYGFSLL